MLPAFSGGVGKRRNKTDTGKEDDTVKENRKKYWLLPTVLILFICEICTLPLVFWLTYAGNAESPDHVLVYKDHLLQWSTNENIREDGAAEFDIFSDKYQSVRSENGEKVVAPGTGADTLVRLKNESTGTAKYLATLYIINEDDRVPLKANVDCPGEETSRHALPANREAKALHSYSGEVNAGEVVDFTAKWKWDFYESDELDVRDTGLGDEAARDRASRVTLGLYIAIEDDEGGEIPPQPQTGDNTAIWVFLALIALTGGVLLFAQIDKRRRRAADDV